MTTQCQHSEYIEFWDGRQLGFCRKCCRILDYPRDGGKPVDVTDEFGGVAPFYVPPERPATIEGQSQDNGPERHTNNYRLSREEAQRAAESRKRGTQASIEIRREKAGGKGKGRNNFERQRYYLAHKDEIIADIREIGVPATRRKWNIPSSTISHHMRVWGVAVPVEKRFAVTKSYYDEHREAIAADMKVMPQADVIAKWGMSRSTYCRLKHRWGVAYEGADRMAFDPKPVEFEPATSNIEGYTAMDIPDDGSDGKFSCLPVAVGPQLPPWRDDWDPSVQCEWLRAYAMMALAREER